METIEVRKSFEEELKTLLNTYSKENSCNTPDFILAQYLEFCLRAFTVAVNRRDRFDARDKKPDACVPGLPVNHFPQDHLG